MTDYNQEAVQSYKNSQREADQKRKQELRKLARDLTEVLGEISILEKRRDTIEMRLLNLHQRKPNGS